MKKTHTICIYAAACILGFFFFFSSFAPPVSAEILYDDPFAAYESNQQLFSFSENQHILLSTDGSQYTRFSCLSDASSSESLQWSFVAPFVYTWAIPGDNCIFLMEETYDDITGIRIGFTDLTTQSFSSYTASVKPSLPLDWRTDGCTLYLPCTSLAKEEPGTLQLTFEDSGTEALFTPTESVEPESSHTESIPSVTVPMEENHTFPMGTTVSDLLKLYADAGQEQEILDTIGNPQESGEAHTGWSICIYDEAQLVSKIGVIIPGSIGGSTVSQNRKLYFRVLAGEILLQDPYRIAADLNQDGEITTADLVLFRKNFG